MPVAAVASVVAAAATTAGTVANIVDRPKGGGITIGGSGNAYDPTIEKLFGFAGAQQSAIQTWSAQQQATQQAQAVAQGEIANAAAVGAVVLLLILLTRRK